MPNTFDDIELRDSLMAAGPAGMVALMYAETIRSLETAVEAVESGDIARRHRAVTRAMDMLTHLYGCLDLEHGGEIAENLGALYRFIMSRLIMVNPHNDAEPARQAILLVKPLHASWQQLARREERAETMVGTTPVRTAEGPEALAS